MMADSDYTMSNKRGLEDQYEPPTDLKRLKSNNTVPSKVLHVRGVPATASEPDLVALCRPFGNVVKTMMLPAKNQAFVQMESVEAASALLQHYMTSPAFLLSKPVYFQYSNREVIQLSAKQLANPLGQGEHKSGESPVNHILLVTILNPRLPVTIENLYQVFSPYGGVRKIITFINKQNQFQALVEMNTVDAAINAKMSLEGKDMFQNCCTLQIGFSTNTEIQVKHNGPRSRDFTVPLDPTAFNPMGAPYGQFNQAPLVPPNPFGQFPPMGNNMVPPPANPSVGGGGAPFGGGGPGPANETPVVLVNNLAEEKVSPDALFTLFGLYGDVIRVKLLYNKKDMALIQFANSHQAYVATLNLNRVHLYGKELVVRPSKHREVALPRPGAESMDMTKDYSDSPLHRYRRAGSKNAKNICPPSPVLFVSNLPDDASKDDITNIFGEGVLAVEFFKTNKNLAFIRMGSTEEAVQGLIDHHNHKLRERNIRVSFSHKDPNAVTGEGNQ